MNGRLYLPLLGFLLWVAPEIAAANEPPPREVCADNGRFCLRIRPGRPHQGGSGDCQAILIERIGKAKRHRTVWQAKLVNDVAPCHVLIHNDGRFVVTLDEHRRGGAAHAAVIYDQRGKLLREFGLRELLCGEDWRNLKVNKRAIEWLTGARFAFVDAPPHLLITLKWGRTIRIDLAEGALIDNQQQTERAEGKQAGQTTEATAMPEGDTIPPEILALLEQPATSAPASQPTTREIATDEAVQRALADLQRLAALADVQVEQLDEAKSAEAASDAAPSPDDNEPGLRPGQEQPGLAGNSGTTAVPVPAPDPAHPVDYVAWMQAQTLTEGPSAAPWYQAAIDGFVEWEGDRDVYAAAMDGDAQALASPEIMAWLEANAEALEQFRAATQLEYRGMPIETADETIISFLLPHLSKMRQLSKAAVIEGQRLTSQGEHEAALDVYLDTLAVGAHASHGPMLIENLVGNAIQNLASSRLLDSFAADAEDRIDYASLSEELAVKYQPLRPLEETLQFERVMALDIVQRSFEVNPETGNYRVSENGLHKLGSSFGFVGSDSPGEAALGFMLGNVGFASITNQINRHYDQLTDGARLPYWQGREKLRELEDELSDPAFRWRNPLLSMLLPSLSRATQISVRAEANRRATMLVANVKAYRQQHGAYPDSLDALDAGNVIVDPFTGSGFAYRRTGDDFTLYSLGSNGVDDGGVHDRRGDTNDLVYWPRPPED